MMSENYIPEYLRLTTPSGIDGCGLEARDRRSRSSGPGLKAESRSFERSRSRAVAVAAAPVSNGAEHRRR